MSDKRTVIVIDYEDWIQALESMRMHEVVEYINTLVKRYGPDARLEFDYDCERISGNIYYNRQETDLEYAKRLRKEEAARVKLLNKEEQKTRADEMTAKLNAECAAKKEEDDKTLLKILLAKYGTPNA